MSKNEAFVTSVGVRNINAVNDGFQIIVNRGGTRSSKTYSLLQLLILWLLTGKIGNKEMSKGLASIVRKTLPSIKRSVLRDFENICIDWGVLDLFEVNKSELTYQYEGRTVEFFSADNQQKIRGAGRDILYCNEGNELSFKKEFYQLNQRTRQLTFLDFNPDDDEIWINKEIECKRSEIKKDVAVIISNYLDNDYLSIKEREEIEYLRETDKDYWQIFGLGEYGNIRGLAIKNWETIEAFPKEVKSWIGIDFGWSPDPTTAVQCYIDEDNREIYLNELCYNTELTMQELAKVLKKQGNVECYCDTDLYKIFELKKMGVNALKVKKGAGSIENGLEVIARYKLRITSSSVNLLKEIRGYKHKQDNAGNTINQYIGIHGDHAIDAARYAIVMRAGMKRIKAFY